MQTYKGHEKSRESIEMAFDTILQEKMKVRHKQGFKPPKRGRKTDLEGDPEVGARCLYSALQNQQPAQDILLKLDTPMSSICTSSSAGAG